MNQILKCNDGQYKTLRGKLFDINHSNMTLFPVPAPSCWQIDQSEVSAFFLTSICKHLFMGFLLMHSILEKAERTALLEKLQCLEKRGGGVEEAV